MPRLELSEWRVEQLRLTAFPMVGSINRSVAWWDEAVGSPADETNSNSKKGSASASGAVGAGKLALQLEPERIDWRLVPADLELNIESLSREPELPGVGTVESAIAAFSPIAERWLSGSDIPELARVAFGAVFLHKEESLRAAYLRLPDYVPIVVDPESSDFLYQINRRSPSEVVAGLAINRLSKWSVGAFKMMAVQLTATGVATPMLSPAPTVALRIEMDVNSAPEFSGPLRRDQLVPLFRELVESGRQLAINGVRGE